MGSIGSREKNINYSSMRQVDDTEDILESCKKGMA